MCRGTCCSPAFAVCCCTILCFGFAMPQQFSFPFAPETTLKPFSCWCRARKTLGSELEAASAEVIS